MSNILTYQTGTLYKRKTSVEKTFDLAPLFEWAESLDSLPKRTDINTKITALMGLKGIAYGRASELTESTEFLAACQENGTANVMALPKSAKKEDDAKKGPRGSNSGMTNSNYETFGKHVTELLTAKSKGKEVPEKDYRPTLEWAKTAIGKVMKESKTAIEARPEVVKSDKDKLAAVNEKITAAVLKAHKQGLTAEAIVDALYGAVDSATVEAILASE